MMQETLPTEWIDATGDKWRVKLTTRDLEDALDTLGISLGKLIEWQSLNPSLLIKALWFFHRQAARKKFPGTIPPGASKAARETLERDWFFETAATPQYLAAATLALKAAFKEDFPSIADQLGLSEAEAAGPLADGEVQEEGSTRASLRAVKEAPGSGETSSNSAPSPESAPTTA